MLLQRRPGRDRGLRRYVDVCTDVVDRVGFEAAGTHDVTVSTSLAKDDGPETGHAHGHGRQHQAGREADGEP
ncbi:hypothetical protein ACTMU2_36825 [Cupriavidus basilensis]